MIWGAKTETSQRNLIIRRHITPLELYVYDPFYFEAFNHCLSEELLQVLCAEWFGVWVFGFKLTFQWLSHGFLSCHLQVPVHPFSSGSSYWPRNHVAACRHPSTSTEADGKVSQGKRGRVPVHWQPGLTAVSGDTSVFSNTDKTISVISKQEKSHTSLPLPDPTSLFHWWSTCSCPHDPAPALAFISLIFTQR